MMRKKILLIDDEKGFTSMLSLNLRNTGNFDVEVVNDPVHAIEFVRKFMPDLILLDIIMPHLEGPDIAIALNQIPELRDIPIVFLTATVTKQEVSSQRGSIGGRPFVAKPSTLSELLVSIQRNLVAV